MSREKYVEYNVAAFEGSTNKPLSQSQVQNEVESCAEHDKQRFKILMVQRRHVMQKMMDDIRRLSPL